MDPETFKPVEGKWTKHRAIMERAFALNGTPAWTQEAVDEILKELHDLDPGSVDQCEEFAQFVAIFPPINAKPRDYLGDQEGDENS